jgi:hypothetical protein
MLKMETERNTNLYNSLNSLKKSAFYDPIIIPGKHVPKYSGYSG